MLDQQSSIRLSQHPFVELVAKFKCSSATLKLKMLNSTSTIEACPELSIAICAFTWSISGQQYDTQAAPDVVMQDISPSEVITLQTPAWEDSFCI